MIKGVVFDADGVIIDSMSIWDKAAYIYLEKIDKTPQDGLAGEVFSMSAEQCASYLKTNYEIHKTVEEIQLGVKEVISDFYKFEVKAKVGIENILEEFKKRNIPMAIATSGYENLLDAALTRLELREYFKGIFSCTDYETTKESPKIYQLAAKSIITDEKVTLAAKKVLVIEDTLYSIKTVKKAGFTTLAVEDYYSRDDKIEIVNTADYYFKDFTNRKEVNNFVGKITSE